jgi:hypothetical protein
MCGMFRVVLEVGERAEAAITLGWYLPRGFA